MLVYYRILYHAVLRAAAVPGPVPRPAVGGVLRRERHSNSNAVVVIMITTMITMMKTIIHITILRLRLRLRLRLMIRDPELLLQTLD